MPDHVPAMLHLARLAASDGRFSDVADWKGRVLRLNPKGDRALEAKGLLAVTTKDPKRMESFLSDARQASDSDAIIAANVVTGFGPPTPTSRRWTKRAPPSPAWRNKGVTPHRSHRSRKTDGRALAVMENSSAPRLPSRQMLDVVA
jgi:hypothetical protein